MIWLPISAARSLRGGSTGACALISCPKFIIIDEMGYLPLDDLGATIFFQLISPAMRTNRDWPINETQITVRKIGTGQPSER